MQVATGGFNPPKNALKEQPVRGVLEGRSGSLGPPSCKKCFERGPGGGGNYSNYSKLSVLINIQYFHIRVCRTKIRNRNYLK